MNFANALGFVGFGSTMLILPLVAPAWFPHTAIDGSSTRALWTQTMGILQCGLGVVFSARLLAASVMNQARRAAIPRGAVATADWAPDGGVAPTAVLAVNFARAPE